MMPEDRKDATAIMGNQTGFLDASESRGARALIDGNNLGTLYGAADGVCKAAQAPINVSTSSIEGLGPRAARAAGLPGSGAMSYVGGALSALGLVDNSVDIYRNGANAANVTSAASNGLNVGASVAGILGAPGGAAAGVVAPALGAAALGLTIGSEGNSIAKEKGWLGQNESGENRNWSDMAADWGRSTNEAITNYTGSPKLGYVAGMGNTLGGSILGVGGAVASSVYGLGSGVKTIAGGMADEGVDLWGSILE